MKFKRYFTDGRNPFDYVIWTKEDIELKNFSTGEVIFKMEQAEVPVSFSKNAREILASKYFRMTEVPISINSVDEDNKTGIPFPKWLRRSELPVDIKHLQEELRVLKDEEEYLRSRCDKKELSDDLKTIRQKISVLKSKLDKNFTHENSAKQVFHRLAGFWTYWGWMDGYFDSEQDAKVFYEESVYMMISQMVAPNTPQIFNSGLYWAYGLEGEKKGFYRYNPDTKEVEATPNFYKYPGIHACFILGVSDSLFDEGGVYDNLLTEAKAFACGGGAGKNSSSIRSKYEHLRTGGKASGSMEFALIDDRNAGVIRSGSSQRRAAKMVIKDMDDPEVVEFIKWKAIEEKKVAALAAAGFSAGWEGEAYKTVSGQNSNNSVRIPDEFVAAIADEDTDWHMTSRTTGEVVRTIKARDLWKLISKSCFDSGDPGVQYDSIIQAWDTCPRDGRIRATNPCLAGDTWVYTNKGPIQIAELAKAGKAKLATISDGKVTYIDSSIFKTGKKQIWRLYTSVGSFIEMTGDHKVMVPGVGYVEAKNLKPGMPLLRFDKVKAKDKLIKCIPQKFDNYGYDKDIFVKSVEQTNRIEDVYDATVPEANSFFANGILVHNCAEFIFKDNTACNLASINLQSLIDGKSINLNDLKQICNHWMTILDISVGAAQLPSKQLAEGTAVYRATGLGHAGIGAVLEQFGISYDSDTACHFAAAITSLMTAQCYAASAKLANRLGTFERYKINKKDMLRVISNHRLASYGNLKQDQYDNLAIKPWEINHSMIPKDLSKAVMSSWDDAVALGKKYGYRNAFVTVIQPSGTIGILMDCDTTSIEPDYSAIKMKRLSGGGMMKIVNASISKSLANLGYTENQIDDIEMHIAGNNTLDNAPYINRKSLIDAGLIEKDIDLIESRLDSATQLRDTFYKLSSESIRNIGLIPGRDEPNLFKQMNFTKEQYLEATKWICGHGTVEGAPHIKKEHLPIFDCATRSGFGSRFLRWQSHVRMVSAVSPFVSGGISKTINMTSEAAQKDIESAMLMAYDGRGSGSDYCPGGIKCISIYRDGSKKSQPLINAYDMAWWDRDQNIDDDRVYLRGTRKRSPKKRNMIAHEVSIKNPAGPDNKFIIKFGEYDDGTLSEIWIEVTKDNPSFYLAMKWASRAISNAIQYGMPLDDILKSFVNEEGGPGGITDHKYITFCKSIIDFAVKLAMLEYEGDITYCRRRPPLHEIRCGQVKRNDKEEIKLEEKTAHLKKVDDGTCPKCGSKNINRFPCPVCVDCGHQSGGCGI